MKKKWKTRGKINDRTTVWCIYIDRTKIDGNSWIANLFGFCNSGGKTGKYNDKICDRYV